MPSTVASVMAAAGLKPDGLARWGEPLPDRAGIYVVTLGKPTRSRSAALPDYPASLPAIGGWLKARPELTLNGKTPTAPQLAAGIGRLWPPDEVVLYIGKADDSLRRRVRGYYRTELGERQPHAGGRYLKTVAVLDELYVHYTYCEDGQDSEAAMIRSFMDRVSKTALRQLRDPAHPFPFANSELREFDRLTRKRRRYIKDHGLKNDIERQGAAGPPEPSPTGTG